MFIFSFWYFILFALFYTGSITIDLGCNSFESAVQTYSPLNGTMDLLTCPTNTTVLSALGFEHYLTQFNFSSIVDPIVEQIDSQKSQINQTATINAAKSQLSSFSNMANLNLNTSFNISSIRVRAFFCICNEIEQYSLTPPSKKKGRA